MMDLASIKYKMTNDDVMVIIDPSLKYCRNYYNPGKDTILSDKYSDATWNIFKEIIIDDELIWDDCEDEAMRRIYHKCRLVSKSFFVDRQSISQPYFVNAAQEVLAAILYQSVWCNIDSSVDDKNALLTNKKLSEMFDLWDTNDFCRFLSTNNMLTNIAKLISTPARDFEGNLIVDENHELVYTCDNQEQGGVFQEVVVAVKDVINNVWAQSGDFSIRKFVRDRGAKTLFLDVPHSSNIHHLFVDLILHENDSQTLPRGEIFLVVPNERLLNSRHFSYLNDISNLCYSGSLQFIAGCDTKDSFYFRKLNESASIRKPNESASIGICPPDCIW